MTNTIMAIVAALILTENSGPTEIGKAGEVGILQIGDQMMAEYARLGGKLPPEARRSPMKAKQMATLILTRRMEKRGLRGDREACVAYAAWLWNPRDSRYCERVKGNMR